MASDMEIDRFGRLWVTGGGGSVVPGVITSFRVYDTKSGALLADVTVPDAAYLNDVTVTRAAAWLTDSFRPSLVRVPIGDDGKIGVPEKTLSLRNRWRGCSASNGPRRPMIRSAADFEMMNSGAIWRIVKFVHQYAVTRRMRSSSGSPQGRPR